MRLPSGVNFYRLLEARPGLTQHLAAILSHAPALAEQLGRRPELLDGLIDASAFEPARPVDELAARFARTDRADEDYQLMLDRVRRRVNEMRFALGAQVVLGAERPDRGRRRLCAGRRGRDPGARRRHRRRVREGARPGAGLRELVILGLGRLGGGALTHASDLDLIYLFSGSHEGESDGAKPLRATDYFNRLAPRISARSVGADRGRAALRRRHPAAALGRRRAARHLARHLRRLSAREGLDLRAYGADPGAAGLRLGRRTRRRWRGIVDDVLRDASATPPDVAADAARMRLEIARHKTPQRAVRHQARRRAGWSTSNSRSTRSSSRTAPPSRPGSARRSRRWSRPGLVPPEIAGAHRLLARLLVTLRLVAPDSAEPPPASRAAGRARLRTDGLGGTACGARRGAAKHVGASCGARSTAVRRAEA